MLPVNELNNYDNNNNINNKMVCPKYFFFYSADISFAASQFCASVMFLAINGTTILPEIRKKETISTVCLLKDKVMEIFCRYSMPYSTSYMTFDNFFLIK